MGQRLSQLRTNLWGKLGFNTYREPEKQVLLEKSVQAPVYRSGVKINQLLVESDFVHTFLFSEL